MTTAISFDPDATLKGLLEARRLTQTTTADPRYRSIVATAQAQARHHVISFMSPIVEAMKSPAFVQAAKQAVDHDVRKPFVDAFVASWEHTLPAAEVPCRNVIEQTWVRLADEAVRGQVTRSMISLGYAEKFHTLKDGSPDNVIAGLADDLWDLAFNTLARFDSTMEKVSGYGQFLLRDETGQVLSPQERELIGKSTKSTRNSEERKWASALLTIADNMENDPTYRNAVCGDFVKLTTRDLPMP